MSRQDTTHFNQSHEISHVATTNSNVLHDHKVWSYDGGVGVDGPPSEGDGRELKKFCTGQYNPSYYS